MTSRIGIAAIAVLLASLATLAGECDHVFIVDGCRQDLIFLRVGDPDYKQWVDLDSFHEPTGVAPSTAPGEARKWTFVTQGEYLRVLHNEKQGESLQPGGSDGQAGLEPEADRRRSTVRGGSTGRRSVRAERPLHRGERGTADAVLRSRPGSRHRRSALGGRAARRRRSLHRDALQGSHHRRGGVVVGARRPGRLRDVAGLSGGPAQRPVPAVLPDHPGKRSRRPVHRHAGPVERGDGAVRGRSTPEDRVDVRAVRARGVGRVPDQRGDLVALQRGAGRVRARGRPHRRRRVPGHDRGPGSVRDAVRRRPGNPRRLLPRLVHAGSRDLAGGRGYPPGRCGGDAKPT